MSNVAGVEENIIEQLHKSVKNYISRVGADNTFAQGLMHKIQTLQKKLEELSSHEQNAFLRDMKDSFRATIEKIETKLQTYSNFEEARYYSILAAGIFVVISVFALFGYKLYKSLMEKELKKQEKQKNKQAKKSKKSN